MADLIASSGDLADSQDQLQPAPESVFDPTFVLPPHTASDFVTADYRWTDTAGTSSGNTTLALGATGGVVTWSVAGAGLSNQAGGSFFTGSTVDMGSFLPFDYQAVLRQAFDAWAAAANIEFIQIADQGGNIGVGTVATIRIAGGFIDGQSGGNVLASAYFPFNNSIFPYAGDVVFDSGNTGFFSSTSNFYLTALHEIGHTLGLDHEPSGGNLAIMNPSINTALFGTGPLSNSLQQDDINGIRAVYGTQDFGPNNYYLPSTQLNIDLIDAAPSLSVNGNSLDNTIDGTSAAEALFGAGGNDTLVGRAGQDILDGGLGSDTADYGYSTDSWIIDLVTGLAQNTTTGETDTLTAIENLIAGTGGDLFTLPAGLIDNRVDGGTGSDRIILPYLFGQGYTASGAANNLILSGTAGVDTFIGIESVTFSDGQTKTAAELLNPAVVTVAGSVSIDDVAVTEGDSGTKLLTFTVTRTGGTAAFGVTYGTADNTASGAAGDYVPIGGDLAFGVGVNTMPVSVTIVGDTTVEPTESFFMNLSNATNGATITDSQGVGTITNDDSAVVAVAGSVSINDVAVTEGDSGTKLLTFTVTRTGGTAAFGVTYGTWGNTASGAAGDYIPIGGDLAFATGVNTMTASVTILGDTTVEPTETFFMNLSNATNGATISDSQGVGTITNDDVGGGGGAVAGSVSINDVAVTEGDSGTKLLTFTVTRTGGTAAFGVTYGTAGNTASGAAGDYIPIGGDLAFATGVNTMPVSVTILGDTTVEPTETFFMNLSNATNGATISDDQGLGTITNDDVGGGGAVAGSVSINDVAVTEGDSGTKLLTFTVTRTGGTAAFGVTYGTAGNTASGAAGDYVPIGGDLAFATGVNTMTASVTILGDTTVEPTETFFMNLSNATNGATISDDQGLGTITNDDVGGGGAVAGSVSINDVAVTEGDSGTKLLTFTVTRTGGTAAFGVSYGTAGNTASGAAGDYIPIGGDLAFGVGVNSMQASVTILGDTTVEPTETFFMNLSNATNGATISDDQGLGTITNDDVGGGGAVAGSVSINDVTVTEGNSGTKLLTFTVTRTGGTAAFGVTYGTWGNTASGAAGDYIPIGGDLAFGLGVNTMTASVTILGDTTVEPTETFFMNLSNATNGATISDDQGLGTITNDDSLPLVIADLPKLDAGDLFV